jgi:pre-60S factor REI1
MKKMYGFFVPQAEYCKNMKGLLEYLQEKIEVGLMCIFCDDKK